MTRPTVTTAKLSDRHMGKTVRRLASLFRLLPDAEVEHWRKEEA